MIVDENGTTDLLTARELDILRCVAEGLTNRQIAEALFLSPETVKWYLKQLFRKLAAGNRTEAVAHARTRGLLVDGQETAALLPRGESVDLPAELSSFVGRRQEIAEVSTLLKHARLVTLTGPGGVGKTRLALQVAASIADQYPHGVRFVSLAGTIDPALVHKTIAQRLGLIEQAGHDLTTALRRHLRDKQLLLVLDNYEHVLAAASLVTDLLSAAPALTVLATSRETLRLTGEHEYLVPPLSVPERAASSSPDELAAYESVDLLVQRARAAQAGFQMTGENALAVAGICQRLDGLPLAIELAAARIRVFSPQQLLERLDSSLSVLTTSARDLPARQRTLRQTIAWSYELLSEAEQRLFARLGVFVDGRSIDAVEAVCGPDPGLDVVDGLESLLSKSLLYQEEGPDGQPRFYMLETIQEFALEKLDAAGELEEVRDRHLHYFLSLGEAMEGGYRRHGQMRLLARTDAELGNIRAAFEWAMATGQLDAAAGLVSSIDYYLEYFGSVTEGYEWVTLLVERLDELSLDRRVRFLRSAAVINWSNGRLAESASLAEQGLVLARARGDRALEGWLLTELAIATAADSDDPAVRQEAIRQCQMIIDIFTELGDKPGMAMGYNLLGEVLRLNGDYEEARRVYEIALALSEETGELNRQSLIRANLSFVAYRLGEFEEARDLAVVLLRDRYASGMRAWFLIDLAVLAAPLGQLGQPEKGARLLGASAAILAEIGAPYQASDLDEIDLYIKDIRALLDKETFDAAWNEGAAMTYAQVAAYVQADQKGAERPYSDLAGAEPA